MNRREPVESLCPIAVAACPAFRPKFALLETLVLLCAFTTGAQAAGTVFSTLLAGSGQDMALAVTSDAQNNVYVAGLTYSPDFPVTAGVFQPTFGQTCDAFIAKLGPDGQVIWSTYLGGILDDWATGIAVDHSGNVWVSGYTRSPDFPLVNPLQSTPSDDFNAFVAKFDPAGSKLLYSTYLSGGTNNGAAGLALDAAGNVYVAVNAQSATGYPGIYVDKLTPQGVLVYSFFNPNGTATGLALDAAGSAYVTGATGNIAVSSSTIGFLNTGGSQALAFKISPDGLTKIYQKTFGGSVQTAGAAIAVDGAGEAWIAGNTSSVDFPLVKPLQSSPGARPLWRSANGGSTWTPIDNLPFAIPLMTLVDPTTPTTLYEATADLGVFKSVDGGAAWTSASNGLAGMNIQALAIDPLHPMTLYASQYMALGNGSYSSVIYKSGNGAGSWSQIDLPPFPVSQLAVDAKNTSIVWEIGAELRKSTDGGVTWSGVSFPGPSITSFALDPNVSGQVIAGAGFIFCSFECSGTAASLPLLYRSVDGGATWLQLPVSIQPNSPLLIDGSTNPSTIYDGLAFASTDGGVTWMPIATPPPGMSPSLLALDPSGAVYAESTTGVYVSHDHAKTWTALSPLVASPVTGVAIASLVPAGSSGTLYIALNQVSTAGFVSKLSADGATLEYSTYLRGHPSLTGAVFYAAEPNVFMTQNWISAIALDAAGNATVAGGTRSVDFPIASAAQSANAGLADAFVTTISADGSKFTYSTYYGGSQDDAALAAALDSQGNPILAGQTFSEDFPVPGGATSPFSYGNAFVVKLPAPAPPAIASVLSAASYLPGIEAGSWVMIQGTNLANVYPGQVWAAADFTGNNLPTVIGGVSVTIDGKPAFVEYISPTQINVQAPSDMTTGTVNVVVTNNGQVSAPATAQLLPVAPALFMVGSSAIASILPGYTLVTAATPAMPGDFIVLWGTGFGPTDPPTAAGAIVTGTPFTSATPIVTVGGMQVPVVSSLLTAGTVGLYQITVQLPANVPAGAVAVQASIGGVQTQAGITLFVGSK